jgi:hypothetical protein
MLRLPTPPKRKTSSHISLILNFKPRFASSVCSMISIKSWDPVRPCLARALVVSQYHLPRPMMLLYMGARMSLSRFHRCSLGWKEA